MDKKTLKQYKDLQNEIKDINKKLKNMEKETVSDSVKTSGDFPYSVHNCIVEGVDNRMYHFYKRRLRKKLDKLTDLRTQIFDFIDGIEDSKTRQIFTYRYIDGLEWIRIGIRMEKSEDSVRIKHDRFLKKYFG